MNAEKRIAVLVSGNGTNLQAIIDAVDRDKISAELILVISNRPGAKALERAEQAHVPTLCLPHDAAASRTEYDEKLLSALSDAKVDLVVLAGFDRLLSPDLVKSFRHRLLNIHPALLPAFPGLHGLKQALDYGVRITGVTVHFVDEGLDTGPIILQEAVPIYPDDTEAGLAERVHAVEHRLYPEAIRLWVEGRLKVQGRNVTIITGG